MNPKEIIKELYTSGQIIYINQIKAWLGKHENHFKAYIEKSNCRKWNKWLQDNSIHIYPCVCNIREEDCIFIETYYKLAKIQEFHQKEEYFNSLVTEYKQISDNRKAVLDWMKKHQSLGSYVVFNIEIDIMLEIEPYKSLKIKLNENDFKSIIEFKRLITNFK